MFLVPLSFAYLGNFPSENEDVERCYKFRFKTNKHTYIVDIEQYKNQIFILKFYLKNHRNSKNRFSFRTHEGQATAILSTCLKIAVELYIKIPLASFGFVGGNDVDEKISNNKRYRIYKAVAFRFFSEEKFEHYKNDKNSLFLLFNKENQTINKEEVILQIEKTYTIS